MSVGTLSQLKKFIMENQIVGTSVGVSTGFAVNNVIMSMVNDLIVPLVLIVLRKFHIDFLKKYLPETSKTSLDLGSFIKQLISFVIVIGVSFIFIKISFDYFLGIESGNENPKKDKKDKNDKS